MGLGGAYRFGGDFKFIIWGRASHKEMGTFFMASVDPQVKCKNLHIQHALILIMKKQNSNQNCED